MSAFTAKCGGITVPPVANRYIPAYQTNFDQFLNDPLGIQSFSEIIKLTSRIVAINGNRTLVIEGEDINRLNAYITLMKIILNDGKVESASSRCEICLPANLGGLFVMSKTSTPLLSVSFNTYL